MAKLLTSMNRFRSAVSAVSSCRCRKMVVTDLSTSDPLASTLLIFAKELMFSHTSTIKVRFNIANFQYTIRSKISLGPRIIIRLTFLDLGAISSGHIISGRLH